MVHGKIIAGSVLCLIASLSWGAMFPVAHSALQQIDPFYFSFIRYAVVAVILSALLFVKEGRRSFRLEGRGRSLLLLGSLAFTAYNMCVFYGQQLMGEEGIIAASIMEVLMPMIAIVLLWIRTGSAPRPSTLVNIGIAFAGAMLVITNGKLSFFAGAAPHVVPLLLIFAGVAGWVMYSMGGERYRDWSILRFSTLTCLLGSVVSLFVVTLVTAFGGVPVPTWDTLHAVRYEMAFMIGLPGLAALLSWNAGMKLLSPVNGILFINLVPVTTFAIMALQGYRISSYECYGTLLVIFALVRSNAAQRSRQGRNDTPRRNAPANERAGTAG